MRIVAVRRSESRSDTSSCLILRKMILSLSGQPLDRYEVAVAASRPDTRMSSSRVWKTLAIAELPHPNVLHHDARSRRSRQPAVGGKQGCVAGAISAARSIRSAIARLTGVFRRYSTATEASIWMCFF